MQDQDSILDSNIEMTQNSLCLTPKKKSNIYVPAELDGKQIVNNINEAQTSRITEQSYSLTKLKASKMLSQTSVNSTLGVGSRFGDCHQCKAWRRINLECRNFAARVNYSDFLSVLKSLEEMAKLEGIQRMAPELSRQLVAIKENFKCQYEKE